MRLIFGPEDEEEYLVAKRDLLAPFASWLPGAGTTRPQDAEATVGTADLVLEWKYRHSDRDLGLWTLSHFDDFLLRWFPRNVAIPGVLAAKAPRELNLFMLFLASQNLLGGGSSSARSFERYFRQIVPAFMRSFEDPTGNGPAKPQAPGLFDVPDTVDTGPDHSQVNPTESPWMGLLNGTEFSAAPVLSTARACELAEKAPVIRKFRSVHRFCERPRKLTQTGNLTVADAIALATELGVDEGLINRNPKVRSASELGELHFFVAWAIGTGVVRRLEGTLAASGSWMTILPVDQLQRALTILLETGPLSLAGQSTHDFDNVSSILDAATTPLLAILYGCEDSPVGFAELVSRVQPVVLESAARSSLQTFQITDARFAQLFQQLWDVLDHTGVVELREHQEPGEPADTRRTPLSLALTTLGRTVVASHLEKRGMTIPARRTLPEFAGDEVGQQATLWS